MAANVRTVSQASTLVAGTSEYIQLDSTKAKARLPWSSNSWSRSDVGRKNHAELIRAALTATVSRVSKGGWVIRWNSDLKASARVPGSWSSVVGPSTDAGSEGADDIGTRLHTPGSRTGVSSRWRRRRVDAKMRSW